METFSGIDLLGAVDRVPGLCYVATQFLHLKGLPLFPLQSFIVAEGTEDGHSFQGKRVKYRWKSVLVAYYRGWVGLVAGVLCGLSGAVSPLLLGVDSHPAQAQAFLGGLLGAIVATGVVLLSRSWAWVWAEGLIHAGSVWVWVVATRPVAGKLALQHREYLAWLPVLLVGNIALAAYSLSRLFDRASQARAIELGKVFGLDAGEVQRRLEGLHTQPRGGTCWIARSRAEAVYIDWQPFGVTLCGGRGLVRWNQPTPGRRRYRDFDAVWFFHVLGIPVVPLRPVHVMRQLIWNFLRDYDWHPIRWSWSLVLRAWLRRASLILTCYATGLLVVSLLLLEVEHDPQGMGLLRFSIVTLVVGPIPWGLLQWFDRRDQDIRLVIGNHRLGSGDPVTYDPEWIAGSDMETPQENWGTATWAEAARNCIQIHNWWGAMFAARRCTVTEDREVGLELTEEILSNPEVRAGIAEVRADPQRWHALLGPGRYGR
jgi:hypothetical protein